MGRMSTWSPLFLRAACCAALAVTLVPTVRAERLPITRYTSSEGLGGEMVQRIVRDSRGFLWIGTRDGLSRFDGQRFVTYTTEDGLPDPTVNDLLETRSGEYWIATNGGGLCRFDPRKEARARGESDTPRGEESLCTVVRVGEDRNTNRVNRLCEDREGRLWATTDAGLFVREEEIGGGGIPAGPAEPEGDG